MHASEWPAGTFRHHAVTLPACQTGLVTVTSPRSVAHSSDAWACHRPNGGSSSCRRPPSPLLNLRAIHPTSPARKAPDAQQAANQQPSASGLTQSRATVLSQAAAINAHDTTELAVQLDDPITQGCLCRAGVKHQSTKKAITVDGLLGQTAALIGLSGYQASCSGPTSHTASSLRPFSQFSTASR